MSTRRLMLSATAPVVPGVALSQAVQAPSLQVPSLTHHHMAADAAPADLSYANVMRSLT